MSSVVSEIRAARRSAPADYLALVKKFPLRAIATEADYDAAAKVLDRLAVRDEARLSRGEGEYMDALATLVESYDSRHQPFDRSDLAPVDALKAMMELHELDQSDIARSLGSESSASMILGGRRAISKGQAKILSMLLRVDAGLFL